MRATDHYIWIVVILFHLTDTIFCADTLSYSQNVSGVFTTQTNLVNESVSEPIAKPIATTASLILVIYCCVILLCHDPTKYKQVPARQVIAYSPPLERREIGRIRHNPQVFRMGHTGTFKLRAMAG